MTSTLRTPSAPQKSLSPSKAEMSTTCFERNKTGSISFADLSVRLSSRCEKTHHRQKLQFKPEIHQLPMDLYTERYPAAKISKEQIYERLIEDATIKIRQRLIVKLQNQKEKEKECTFHPQISEFHNYLRNRQFDQRAIFDRLFEEAEIKQEQKLFRQKKAQEQLNKNVSSLQKQKKNKKNMKLINEQKHNLEPLYKRIRQVVQQKLQEHKSLASKVAKERQLNFQPKVNINSEQIFKRKVEKDILKKNVVERLMAEHEKHKARQQQRNRQHEEQIKSELPFSPATTNQMNSGSDGNFLQRLKQNFLNKCIHQQVSHTFAPKINKLSGMMVEYSRGEENEQQQLNRLVYEPLEKREQVRQQIQNQMYAQCKFNPQINEISSKINFTRRTHRCEHPVEETFSFKPKINEESRMIRSRSSESAKLKRKKKELEYRCENEYKEMKQCTFKPQLNSYRHQGCRTLGDVEGVSDFIRNTERALEKKRYLEQTSEKLFQLEKRYDKRKQRGLKNF